MAYQVLIPQEVAPDGPDYLKQFGYEIKMGGGAEENDLIRDVVDCDAILLRTAPVTKAVLEAGKNLKIVARHGAGFDNVDLKAAEDLGIWTTNAPLSTTCSVAEFTIALILDSAKKVFPLSAAQRNGDFYFKTHHKGVELEGKTLGVVGFGRIGGAVAKKAALGLEMKVLAFDPYFSGKNYPEYATPVEDLHELLRQSDFVSLHMPATSQTRGMFGKAEFEAMKPTAYFINCARGEVVRESEMIDALQAGVIAGAALDVCSTEPPELSSPLFGMPNVIMTPHMASNTEESMAKMSLHAAMEIHRVLSGHRPYWPVNHPVANRF